MDKRLLFSKNLRKDELLSKMTKIPEGYTHIGVSNVRPDAHGQGEGVKAQVTVIVAAQHLVPMIWDAHDKEWKELVW